MKKFLGIFYKDLVLWLHYIPLALVGIGIVNLIGTIFNYYSTHNLWFNIVLFLAFYISFSISDQLVHAIIGKD